MTSSRANVVSSFTVIKGSMIEETYQIMRDWNFDWSVEQNLGHVQVHNTVGTASSNWMRDLRSVFHRRYNPNEKDRSLSLLAKAGVSMDIWKPIQLWHMTRDEFLVRDFFINWLFQEYTDGAYRIRIDEPFDYLRGLHTKNIVEKEWTSRTVKEVSGSLLRMAVEFGLMKGKNVKEFASYHMPEKSFLYLLHAMFEQHGNGRDVVHSPDWRLYLMSTADVEREIYRLHQFRQLRFEVAGSLMELTLPHKTAAEYVEEMQS